MSSSRLIVVLSTVLCCAVALQCYFGVGGLSLETSTTNCTSNVTNCLRFDKDVGSIKTSTLGCDNSAVCKTLNLTMNEVTNITDKGEAYLCCNSDLCNVKRKAASGISTAPVLMAAVGLLFL